MKICRKHCRVYIIHVKKGKTFKKKTNITDEICVQKKKKNYIVILYVMFNVLSS